MDDTIEAIEMEYTELMSMPPHAHVRFGIRIKTTPQTWEKDRESLEKEVKRYLREERQTREEERLKKAEEKRLKKEEETRSHAEKEANIKKKVVIKKKNR